MGRYQVVFCSVDGTDKSRTLTVGKKHIFLFIMVTVLVIFLFVFSLIINKKLGDDIAGFTNTSYSETDEQMINRSAVVIGLTIEAIGGSDIFFRDMSKKAVFNSKFNYDIVTRYLSEAKNYKDLLRLYSKYNYINLNYLLKVAEILNQEMDKRLEQYVKIDKYMQEQSIILAHTPSIWPSVERITSKFGFRRAPLTGVPSFHEGVDFGSPHGSIVRTTADGVVVFAGVRTGYGYIITVDHGFGYMTRYAHNSKLLVKSGDIVKKGDVISLSGATGRGTGPHLHYEVLYNGVPVNAEKFLPAH